MVTNSQQNKFNNIWTYTKRIFSKILHSRKQIFQSSWILGSVNLPPSPTHQHTHTHSIWSLLERGDWELVGNTSLTLPQSKFHYNSKKSNGVVIVIYFLCLWPIFCKSIHYRNHHNIDNEGHSSFSGHWNEHLFKEWMFIFDFCKHVSLVKRMVFFISVDDCLSLQWS